MSVDTSIGILPKDQIRCQARRALARHGTSFYWAARVFSAPMADEVAALYAFCRTVDDIGDTQSAKTARRKLAAIRADLETASGRRPEVRAFLELAQSRGIDLRLAKLLVDAVVSDLETVRMSSWDELLRYAYGAAGTVGMMMCPVMGVDNPAAEPYAVDLGIAMQLTNIARDVVEDARRDRLYLPVEMVGRACKPADILDGNGDIRRRVVRARRWLLRQAARYYRSADAGMRFIPLRQRLAVMTAARVYESIGNRVTAASVYWGERAYVGKSGKILQTLRAVGSLLGNPKYWPAGRYPTHDSKLHRALTGLPGTDGGVR